MKPCKRCGIEKPTSAYPRHGFTADRRMGVCLSCLSHAASAAHRRREDARCKIDEARERCLEKARALRTPATVLVLACLVPLMTAPREGLAENSPWQVGWPFQCTIASGKAVADADTFTCNETWPNDARRPIVVRLRGVNGVEVGEPGYREAKAFARKLYVGRTMTCRVAQPTTTHGRVGAKCVGEFDIGTILVLGGFAGGCPAYGGQDYVALEPKPFPSPKWCLEGEGK